MAIAAEDVLLCSALEELNIDHYWPEWSSGTVVCEENDDEYPIILLFYETLLSDLLQTNLVDKSSVQISISRLVRNYRSTVNGKTPEDIDYDDLNNCFGYLHRYAACHTALVRTVLKDVFHVSPPGPVKKLLSLKDDLNVVSVGGGPGNDLVGFCSALYGKHFGFLRMNLSIVDNKTGWERIFFRTEKMLQRQNFGNASEVFNYLQVVTYFLKGDLTDRSSWNRDLLTKLENADILLMVKVLSVIPDREKCEVLEGIVSIMKPGAMLVFIDCPFPEEHFSTVVPWLDCVYKKDKKKYDFNYEVELFGFPNITVCQAYVRIYVKRFVVLQM